MISVVIPVYNTEPYIKKCLDSVIYQTYGDLEIILIDDGSTDGSPQICDEYAAKDDRIRVYHIQTAHGTIRPRCQLHQSAYGQPFFRGDVAH